MGEQPLSGPPTHSPQSRAITLFLQLCFQRRGLFGEFCLGLFRLLEFFFDPQRLMECVGSLCHARHPNFAKNGGKPTASGPLESRALSAGKGGGAKVPQTRKPPTGPEPAAKPAINPTSAPPQTTTTTVVKGKTLSVAPAEARPGKPFRPRDKQQVIDDNRQRNGGETKCENCTVGTVPGQKSQKGITPPRNETQIDHKEPRSKGGSGTADNGQVLCRSCNREKSNK